MKSIADLGLENGTLVEIVKPGLRTTGRRGRIRKKDKDGYPILRTLYNGVHGYNDIGYVVDLEQVPGIPTKPTSVTLYDEHAVTPVVDIDEAFGDVGNQQEEQPKQQAFNFDVARKQELKIQTTDNQLIDIIREVVKICLDEGVVSDACAESPDEVYNKACDFFQKLAE